MNWDNAKAFNDARAAIGTLIVRLVGDADGEIRERPLRPGGAFMTREAEPAAGIRAALAVQQAARNTVCSYIAAARSDGQAWSQIGDVLRESGAITEADLTDDSAYYVAIAAFEYAAGPAGMFREPTFVWTCPACGNGISDHGPYDSNPQDNQRGHAAACTRQRDEITAYESAWEDV